MTSSILDDTKKAVGVSVDDTSFDTDIIMHINAVLTVLNQIGIGPPEGLMISDSSTTWYDLIGDDARLNSVMTYVYIRVRMFFDPPQTAHLIAAFENQYKELEYRLSTQRESVAWVDPTPIDIDEEILDGGTP